MRQGRTLPRESELRNAKRKAKKLEKQALKGFLEKGCSKQARLYRSSNTKAKNKAEGEKASQEQEEKWAEIWRVDKRPHDPRDLRGEERSHFPGLSCFAGLVLIPMDLGHNTRYLR